MLTDHDERRLRCRRLGHDVTFRYCRTQEGATVCPLILNCWWQVFEVEAFLAQHLPADALEALREPAPQPKTTTLLDLIRQAQERAGRADAGAKPGG